MDLHIGIVENQFAARIAFVSLDNHTRAAGDQRQLVAAGDGGLAVGVDGVFGADGAGAVLHHVYGVGDEVDTGRICAVERQGKCRISDGGSIGIHIDTKLAFVGHQLTAGDVEVSLRTDHAGMTGIVAGGVVGHTDGDVFQRQACTASGGNTHAGGAIVEFTRIINTDGCRVDDDEVLICAVVDAADGGVTVERKAVVGLRGGSIFAVYGFAVQKVDLQSTVDLDGQPGDHAVNQCIDILGRDGQIIKGQRSGVGVVGGAAAPAGVGEIVGAELEIVDVQIVGFCCKYRCRYQ